VTYDEYEARQVIASLHTMTQELQRELQTHKTRMARVVEAQKALEEQTARIKVLERREEVALLERDEARARLDGVSKILVGIHSAMNPPLFKLPDGRAMEFQNPMANRMLQEISDRIREIPERLRAA
jgi:hypothetical protein